MTERERLIELIVTAENEVFRAFPYTNSTKRIEMVADFLIENGVVPLPCKIGDYCKISTQLTADNSGEGEIKIRYSAIETAQLIGIACVTANENGTQIMDIGNVFAIKECEEK